MCCAMHVQACLVRQMWARVGPLCRPQNSLQQALNALDRKPLEQTSGWGASYVAGGPRSMQENNTWIEEKWGAETSMSEGWVPPRCRWRSQQK